MPKPQIGKTVHVVPKKLLPGEPKGTVWKGTISAVGEKGLTLICIHPGVGFTLYDVQEDQTGVKPGTWHWPEG